MFDPIVPPPNHYLGPAIGDGANLGDTWSGAVAKINAGFERVIAAVKAGGGQMQAAVGPISEFVDSKAREAFGFLKTAHDAEVARLSTIESALSEVGAKDLPDLRARLQDLEAKFAALTEPAPPQAPVDPNFTAEAGVKVETDPEAGLDAVAKALNL